KNKLISEEEMDGAKRSLINGYNEISDSPESLEAWYMGRMLAGLTTSPDEASELVRSVTYDDIAQIASKITLDTVYFMRGTLSGGEESDSDEE
ncbi:MAG: hypothetical protein WCQ72_07340, partial [Eubacteriales bacterium]